MYICVCTSSLETCTPYIYYSLPSLRQRNEITKQKATTMTNSDMFLLYMMQQFSVKWTLKSSKARTLQFSVPDAKRLINQTEKKEECRYKQKYKICILKFYLTNIPYIGP